MTLAVVSPGCCVHEPLYIGHFFAPGLDLFALKCSWLRLAVSAGKEVSVEQTQQLSVSVSWFVTATFSLCYIKRKYLDLGWSCLHHSFSWSLRRLPHPHGFLSSASFSHRVLTAPSRVLWGRALPSKVALASCPSTGNDPQEASFVQSTCRWEQCSTTQSLSPCPVANGLLEAPERCFGDDIMPKSALQLGLIIQA